ncbi:LOW QUALITY PROTEIN: hypothetical protein TorRG33x02_147580 [Trema orientale]|uniref:Uncharacterized protein n=1 Tax=Trema orientale TaxID=63057 RepID=A0A2P5EV63_TREOI|nr:LOW QUALITY PROTEIN: hypothetical protein TorRG33x02_147580 [Trema orientale]
MGKFYSAVCASSSHQITGDSWQESRKNPGCSQQRNKPKWGPLGFTHTLSVGSGAVLLKDVEQFSLCLRDLSALLQAAKRTTQPDSLSLSPFSNFSGNFHGHFPGGHPPPVGISGGHFFFFFSPHQDLDFGFRFFFFFSPCMNNYIVFLSKNFTCMLFFFFSLGGC